MAEPHGEQSKQHGRARLIEAANQLLNQKPFEEITIDEIVKEAKLSRPAFYYHFSGGKEELRSELINAGILQQLPTHDTRKNILDAALRIFSRAGVSAATMDDIANEAHISRGALCWYYHSKEELLSAVIEHNIGYAALREGIAQIERDIEQGDLLGPEAVLRRVAETFYDSFHTQDHTARLCVLLVHTHPEAAHILAQQIAKGRRGITEYINKQQEKGLFRTEINASLFVQVMAMSFIMRSVARGLNDLLPFAHLTREAFIDQLVSLLLYGIQNPSVSSHHQVATEESKQE